jgi:hypothetical protein
MTHKTQPVDGEPDAKTVARLAMEAGQNAVAETLALGLPVVGMRGNQIIEYHADGTIDETGNLPIEPFEWIIGSAQKVYFSVLDGKDNAHIRNTKRWLIRKGIPVDDVIQLKNWIELNSGRTTRDRVSEKAPKKNIGRICIREIRTQNGYSFVFWDSMKHEHSNCIHYTMNLKPKTRMTYVSPDSIKVIFENHSCLYTPQDIFNNKCLYIEVDIPATIQATQNARKSIPNCPRNFINHVIRKDIPGGKELIAIRTILSEQHNFSMLALIYKIYFKMKQHVIRTYHYMELSEEIQ